MKRIYDFLASLTLGLWLTALVILFLALGSFLPSGGEGSSINDMPLFVWLQREPLTLTWWLWVTVFLLAFLALNTVLCGFDTLRRKWGKGNLLLLLAPQLMHVGFLLIVLAHLLSAAGGVKYSGQVAEGAVIQLPDGTPVQIERIQVSMHPMGFPMDYSASLRYGTGGEKSATIAPNHPVFLGKYGLYLKEAWAEPFHGAYLELHREPGAGVALAGALLFTLGNVVLLAFRRGRE